MTLKKTKRIKKFRSQRSWMTFVVCAFALISFTALARFSSANQQGTSSLQNMPINTAERNYILLPVPSRQVAIGEQLRTVPLEQARWPKDLGTRHYVTDTSQLTDSVAVTALIAGSPIALDSVSVNHTESNAVVEGIPVGMRAITVRVDIESAVEGWARSGNFVDVILLRSTTDPNLGLEAKVIAENVRILSAGRSTTPLTKEPSAAQPPATVTLLVDQTNALRIKAAASIGRLTFSLRGQGDQAPTLARLISQRDLIPSSGTSPSEKIRFAGTARGPDGQAYVLTSDSQWLKSADSLLDPPLAAKDVSSNYNPDIP